MRDSGSHPPQDVEFTIPGFDEVQDLHGDVVEPDLVVFMGGNEFMVLPELLPAFRASTGACARIFVESLPPGILHEQLRRGALVVGDLRVAHAPDVFTGGEDRVAALEREGRVLRKIAYASNELALLVRSGNPARIATIADLGRDGVRVAIPDARTEDIGKKVEQALREAGGEDLVRAVTREKVDRGETYVTRIHHRETPRRVLDGASDVGPVWRTEGLHQRALGAALDLVPIDGAPRSTSFAAVLRAAPRARCAGAFVDFLASGDARRILARRGFHPPDAAAEAPP